MAGTEEPPPGTDYTVSLEALEASVRVPEESRVVGRAEPPPPDLIGPDELEQRLTLGVAGG